jgi:hypothetical protein
MVANISLLQGVLVSDIDDRTRLVAPQDVGLGVNLHVGAVWHRFDTEDRVQGRPPVSGWLQEEYSL